MIRIKTPPRRGIMAIRRAAKWRIGYEKGGEGEMMQYATYLLYEIQKDLEFS